MKIVHCCISCFYIDGRNYQENELIQQNVADGHDVLVVTSRQTQDKFGKRIFVDSGEYTGAEGAPVVRLDYRFSLNDDLSSKLRAQKGFLEKLVDFKPDVILFHGISAWEVVTLRKYKAIDENVRIYLDCHESFHNSARSFFSKYVLHYLYYRFCLGYALQAVDKILYVTPDCRDFAKDFYGINSALLEFYPLGGQVPSNDVYEKTRMELRSELGLVPADKVFLLAGKQTKRKKIVESLKVFKEFKDPSAKLLIAGSLDANVVVEASALIDDDSRISTLGWLSAEDLRRYLCAADVYLQPGTQSVTMQNSLCCRCAVIIDDVPAHEMYVSDNGWLIGKELSLVRALELACSEERLDLLGQRSVEYALENLDYKKLASRLYS